MQKKKQNQTKPVKQIILFIIAVILLLLIIFAEDIIKLVGKNKINLAQNPENELITNEANIPKLSAGMIPVKWENNNWVITTSKDQEWYDYSKGKPAYIMLNDGIYQSELIRNMEENGKKLAEDNVEAVVPDDSNTRGSIFIWIPRFEMNEKGDIKYIKDIQEAEEGFEMPELFAYRQESETAPDFLLTGAWVAIDTDENPNSTISEMNSEDGKYGFIKNTIATKMVVLERRAIQNYVDAEILVDTQINNISSLNRTVLKIINQNDQEPMKIGNAYYNRNTGVIEIQVTYSQYGIAKVLYGDNQELKLTKNNNQATATSEGLNIKYGLAKITIIDNKGNTKKFEMEVLSKVYVTLYEDGTLGFCSNNSKIVGKTVSEEYGDISTVRYYDDVAPWYKKASKITAVEFVDEISPKYTSLWFYNLINLTTINNLENLNTSNVTDMAWMFAYCDKLTELNLSHFDTRKVTDMNAMFEYCEALTSLNLDSFDTSKVTNMEEMFFGCNKLTALNLSNFDTGRVANMRRMFMHCDSLTQLDLSSFDTSNITDMSYMFRNCRALASLDISNFDTSKVTNMLQMFYNCRSLTSLDLSSFDTSNVITMTAMFHSCRSLTSLDLSSFDTSKATNMTNMFHYCFNLSQITFGEKWDKEITLPNLAEPCIGWYSDTEFTTKVAEAGANYKPKSQITIYANISQDAEPHIYVTLYEGGYLSFCSNNSKMEGKTVKKEYGDIAGQDYVNVGKVPWYEERRSIANVYFETKISPISTANWFYELENLNSITNIELLDTSNVTDMQYMFDTCSNLTSLDLSNFDTSNVTNMSYMFDYCGLVSLDLSSFDTSKVTNMRGMFLGSPSLTELNISHFDTSNVTDMGQMFCNCKKLETIYVGEKWTTNNANVATMFLNCNAEIVIQK